MDRTSPAATPEPALQAASPRSWRLWLHGLSPSGWQRLHTAGLVLALGFVGAALLLVVFALLAGEVKEQETQALDTAVLSALQRERSPALDLAAQGVSLLGSEGLDVLFVLLLGYFGWRRRWEVVAALVLVFVGAHALNWILKELFQRTRPTAVAAIIPGDSYSFPSGHAMDSASFYSYVAYLGWRLTRGVRRLALTIGMIGLVLLIGLSRLYLGVHYFTDVVAGYLAGLFWTDAVIVGGRLLPGPWTRGRAVPAGQQPAVAPER